MIYLSVACVKQVPPQYCTIPYESRKNNDFVRTSIGYAGCLHSYSYIGNDTGTCNDRRYCCVGIHTMQRVARDARRMDYSCCCCCTLRCPCSSYVAKPPRTLEAWPRTKNKAVYCCVRTADWVTWEGVGEPTFFFKFW